MTGFRPDHAMVLAAGLGVRMRPLTDDRPKPLIEVRERALIDHVLDRLAEAGVRRVVVNLHYRAEQLRQHLAGRGDVEILFSEEEMLLDSGGGVAKALPQLGEAPFFVCNADSLWLNGALPALDRLADEWDEARMDALLLLSPTVLSVGYEGLGDILMQPDGTIRFRREREIAPFVFAGVQIVHPRLLSGAGVEPFSIHRCWKTAQEGGRLFGLRHDGTWYHVGTPDALREAEEHLAFELGHRHGERGLAGSHEA